MMKMMKLMLLIMIMMTSFLFSLVSSFLFFGKGGLLLEVGIEGVYWEMEMHVDWADQTGKQLPVDCMVRRLLEKHFH